MFTNASKPIDFYGNYLVAQSAELKKQVELADAKLYEEFKDFGDKLFDNIISNLMELISRRKRI